MLAFVAYFRKKVSSKLSVFFVCLNVVWVSLNVVYTRICDYRYIRENA